MPPSASAIQGNTQVHGCIRTWSSSSPWSWTKSTWSFSAMVGSVVLVSSGIIGQDRINPGARQQMLQNRVDTDEGGKRSSDFQEILRGVMASFMHLFGTWLLAGEDRHQGRIQETRRQGSPQVQRCHGPRPGKIHHDPVETAVRGLDCGPHPSSQVTCKPAYTEPQASGRRAHRGFQTAADFLAAKARVNVPIQDSPRGKDLPGWLLLQENNPRCVPSWLVRAWS